MPRIIIKHDDDVSIGESFGTVLAVMNQGRISNDDKQYGYAMVFESGLVCLAGLTKTGTDTFNIYREGKK